MRNKIHALLGLMFGPLVPAFRFDKGLYDTLCREKTPGGDQISAPDQEPQVVFEMGPIDGELGRCNMKTGRITIDVLEHFFICMHEGPMTPSRLKQAFDDRMTETLAHEGGHWHLDKRHGFWPMLEKMTIMLALAGLGMLLAILVLTSYNCLMLKWLVPASWAINPVLGISLAVLATIFYVWVLIKVVPIYVGFCMAVSAAITYRICWHERYARNFAKRTKSDPRWEGVVEVD